MIRVAVVVFFAALQSACSPTSTCSPSTCDGCCDSSGVCKLGNTAEACGTKGAACMACSGTCGTNGVCSVMGGEDAGTDAGTMTMCPMGQTPPTGRSDLGGGFDPMSGELIIFGGDPGVAVNCMARPEFSAETWFYSPACNTWRKSAELGPSARSRHVAAFDTKRRRLIVFGGRSRTGTSGPYTVHSDTHALEVGLPAPDDHLWRPLTTRGATPPGLSSATAVYDAAGDRFIVFGGNLSGDGLVFTPSAKVYALAFPDNTWSELTPTSGTIPARLFHAMALDAMRNRLIVFAGGDANAFTGPFLADVYAFDLTTRVWAPLALSGTAPLGRIRPAAVEDPDRDRVLVFGGHDDGQLGETNELWAINLAMNRWDRVKTGDTFLTPGAGTCDFPPNFTTPDLSSPERREGHVLVRAGSLGALMFGGRSDCGTVNDVWKLTPSTGQWELLKQAFAGLSCQRSGKTNCTKLCF